jgi:hypothetical protein
LIKTSIVKSVQSIEFPLVKRVLLAKG